MNRVGIMLDWKLIQSGVRGRKPYERIPYYVEIGNQIGLEPVFFHPRHVNVRTEKVQGFFWNGERLVTRIVNIPYVIHNRVLTGDAVSRRIIRQLSHTRKVFNGLVVRDKGRVHSMLWKNGRIRPFLPQTAMFSAGAFATFLEKFRVVYVKPSVGSVGEGVARIERNGDRFLFTASKQKKSLTKHELKNEVIRWVGRRRFLIQQGIPLALYEGRTFDIRVSVQKNGGGNWTVSGLVAKVANQQNKLSNLSRGGLAVPISKALGQIFSSGQEQRVIDGISFAAIEIAKQYETHFPSLADLGMDMGVDQQGNPYLIEVNVRDQRYSFFAAGELDMFKRTYRHPMEYARRLYQRKIT